MITEVGELLRTLVGVDHQAAIWCASQCARTMLPLIHDEGRPQQALEAAEGWVRGEVSADDCLAAAGASRQIVHELLVSPEQGTRPQGERDAAILLSASAAAGHVAEACHLRGSLAPRTSIGWSVGHVANALTSTPNAPRRDEILERLLALVQATPWPLVAPTIAQLQEAPVVLQVAWDLVASEPRAVEHTIPELLGAHARARRLELDWDDPLQRAIAEHAIDEARLSALLGVRP